MLTDKQIAYLTTLHGWCVPDKMKRLNDLVIEANKNLASDEGLIIVECGVFAGRSLFPMALACKDLNKGTVWGIEAWSNEAAIEGEEISPENTSWWSKVDMEFVFGRFKGSIEFLSLETYVQYIRGKSYDNAGVFADNSISLLHLDSNHNTSTIIKELEVFVPKVKSGGYLVVDDYDWPSVKESYSKIPEYGFELVEVCRAEVPKTNPQEYTEYAIFKKTK